MKITFAEIYTEILTQMGLTASSVDSTILDSIKLRINQVQDWIAFHKDWTWREDKFYMTTWAPYSTGTITVTQGSRTVTGSGTSWDAEMRVGYLKVNNKLYKIDAVASTTNLTLKAPYPDDTEAGASYEIIYPDYMLDPHISGIVDVWINDQTIDFKSRRQFTQSIKGTGEPLECGIGERTGEDFYNTGTADVTNGSASVTISTGTMPDEVEGMTFRVHEHSREYTVKSKDSATTLTLTETYQGDSGSGKSYAIGPKYSEQITFRNTPDKRYWVVIEGLVRPPKLIDANQYSIIPDHSPLLHGAMWLALLDRDNENPVRIQQARADFERALKQMEMTYGQNPNVRWTSKAEQVIRRNNLTNFNPLRDDMDTLL